MIKKLINNTAISIVFFATTTCMAQDSPVTGTNVFIDKNGTVHVQGDNIVVNGKPLIPTADNGKVITRDLSTAIKNIELNSLYCNVGVDVKIDIDPKWKNKESLTVQGEEKILNSLNIEQKDKRVDITSKGTYQTEKPIIITLQTSTLDSIHIKGSGSIDGIYLSQKLHLDISGAAEVKLKGQVEDLNVKIAGAGEANLKQLKSNTSTINVQGTGNAEIFTTQKANIEVTGQGEVDIYGTPKIFSKNAENKQIKRMTE